MTWPEPRGGDPAGQCHEVETGFRRWRQSGPERALTRRDPAKSGARAPIALTRVPAAIYPGDREGPPTGWSRTAGSVPQPGREIALSKVVEQGHETPRPLATCDTFDAHHIGTGGLADKKARPG